eukprot:TRINITY_DN103184_c0_g1_i1.p1 TRINITY_DN103184_c0_g1~~TRINITY_DN103184_c0_g1_i1.p1  ORF type:complete len:910 (+),score=230.15 TRINITY_DN103184_c0_g1_i1:166-2895(+)
MSSPSRRGSLAERLRERFVADAQQAPGSPPAAPSYATSSPQRSPERDFLLPPRSWPRRGLSNLTEEQAFRELGWKTPPQPVRKPLRTLAVSAWEQGMKIMEAILRGDEEMAVTLIKASGRFEEKPDLNVTDRDRYTLLHHAASMGLAPVCHALLESDGFEEVNALGAFNWSALHCAVDKGQEAACIALLDSPRFSAADVWDEFGCTVLHLAARCGHAFLCQLLLEHPAFTVVEKADLLGNTALHYAADSDNFLGCWALLLHANFQRRAAERKNTDFRTALHIAAVSGNAAACLAMCAFPWKVDKEEETANGQTPLDIAVGEAAVVLDRLTSIGLTRGFRLVVEKMRAEFTELAATCRLLLEHSSSLATSGASKSLPASAALRVATLWRRQGEQASMQINKDSLPRPAALSRDAASRVQSILAAREELAAATSSMLTAEDDESLPEGTRLVGKEPTFQVPADEGDAAEHEDLEDAVEGEELTIDLPEDMAFESKEPVAANFTAQEEVVEDDEERPDDADFVGERALEVQREAGGQLELVDVGAGMSQAELTKLIEKVNAIDGSSLTGNGGLSEDGLQAAGLGLALVGMQQQAQLMLQFQQQMLLQQSQQQLLLLEQQRQWEQPAAANRGDVAKAGLGHVGQQEEEEEQEQNGARTLPQDELLLAAVDAGDESTALAVLMAGLRDGRGSEDVVADLGLAFGPLFCDVAAAGLCGVCRVLLQRAKGYQVPTDDGAGNTALHLAAKSGRAEVCLLLLESARHRGANRRDATGRTALHLAAESGHADVCRILLGHSSFTAANTQDVHGCTALHAAAEAGWEATCSVILKDAKFSKAGAQDKEGCTALHCAAARGHALVCRALLEQWSVVAGGSSFKDFLWDARDKFGYTALDVATGRARTTLEALQPRRADDDY